MLTVRTSENTVITSFRLISERQDFSSVRTAENTVRARARIHCKFYNFNWSTTQMKKTLIAAAVMAASGVAFAASNITLYGDVDTSAVLTHDGGASDSKNVIDMQPGFLNGSRWGIKGVEELGNGYAVGFILENGFNSDDGTNGQKYSGGFSRETKLYINGGFGQIGFGRLGSLANGAQSNSILSGWALGTSY